MDTGLKQIFSSIGWMSSLSFISKVSALLSQIVLAYFLLPEDFGLFGISITIIGFFVLIVDGGALQVLIKKQDKIIEWKDDVFSLSLVTAITGMLIVYIIAPIIANLLNDIRLTNLIRILSVIWLFKALVIVPNAILQSNLKYNIISKINIFANLIQASVQIFFASLSFGVYSFVIARIIFEVFILLSYTRFAETHLKLSFRSTNWISIYKDSFWLLLAYILRYVWLQGPGLFISYFFGTVVAGNFYFAYNFASSLIIIISDNVRMVMFPSLLKELDDLKNLKDKYLKVTSALSIALAIIAVLFSLTGELIINLLWGSKWLNAALVFELLILGVYFRGLSSISTALFQAFGLFKKQAVIALYQSLIFMLVVIVSGVYGTPLFFIMALVLFYIISGILEYWYSSNLTINIGLNHILKLFLLPMLVFLIIGLTINYGMSQYHMDLKALKFITFSIIYLTAVLLIIIIVQKKYNALMFNLLVSIFRLKGKAKNG